MVYSNWWSPSSHVAFSTISVAWCLLNGLVESRISSNSCPNQSFLEVNDGGLADSLFLVDKRSLVDAHSPFLKRGIAVSCCSAPASLSLLLILSLVESKNCIMTGFKNLPCWHAAVGAQVMICGTLTLLLGNANKGDLFLSHRSIRAAWFLPSGNLKIQTSDEGVNNSVSTSFAGHRGNESKS